MTKWILAVTLILSAFTSTAIAQTKESLVGTWKLVSGSITNDKGEIEHPGGMNPTGLLIYTADGRFSITVAKTGRKPLSKFSVEEKAEAFDTFTAYAGSYTLSGKQAIHHIEVCLAENLVNTHQVRSVKLDGDRLTLRGGFLLNGVMYAGSSEFVWERLKPGTAGK